ncbi:hypothetical protein Dimus_016511 [Dionaea muscipula]
MEEQHVVIGVGGAVHRRWRIEEQLVAGDGGAELVIAGDGGAGKVSNFSSTLFFSTQIHRGNRDGGGARRWRWRMRSSMEMEPLLVVCETGKENRGDEGGLVVVQNGDGASSTAMEDNIHGRPPPAQWNQPWPPHPTTATTCRAATTTISNSSLTCSMDNNHGRPHPARWNQPWPPHPPAVTTCRAATTTISGQPPPPPSPTIRLLLPPFVISFFLLFIDHLPAMARGQGGRATGSRLDGGWLDGWGLDGVVMMGWW